MDREAGEASTRLGSYSPEMFRDPAIVDEHIGDRAAHWEPARQALSLDQVDQVSQAPLARLEGGWAYLEGAGAMGGRSRPDWPFGRI